MSHVRNRLFAIVLVGTIVPLGATIWIATVLLDRSLGYATTTELDRLSRTLELTGRQFYQRERDALRKDVVAGHISPTDFWTGDPSDWPEEVKQFWEGGESDRFRLSGSGGDHLDLLRRTARGVELFRRDFGGIHMDELSTEFRRTREIVGSIQSRDLRRGFTLSLLVLIAVVWILSLAPLVFFVHRIGKPIQQLTAGLNDFAKGEWNRRLEPAADDDVGRAIQAFNRMGDELRANRDRLIYLAQMTSWQTLARKTAHELKNSLTPIRLTVEELLARQPTPDRAFIEEATRIVVSEIETLERRVRAFSEFASDPTTRPEALDVNALANERVLFLKSGHPDTTYRFRLDESVPCAYASPDLVKGILTNLLENAAEAAGPGGTVLVVTAEDRDRVRIEIHDSGPGVSAEAAATLFEPTITFKPGGMGLGLSIARKNALLCGGDVTVVAGELGGAGFSVTLPRSDVA